MTTALSIGLMACQNNFSASSELNNAASAPDEASTSRSGLSLIASTSQDGVPTLTFIKPHSPANPQAIFLRLGGFNPGVNKIFGCASSAGNVNCSLSTSFVQIYPALSSNGWSLHGNILRGHQDLSNLQTGSYEIRIRKDRMDATAHDEITLQTLITEPPPTFTPSPVPVPVPVPVPIPNQPPPSTDFVSLHQAPQSYVKSHYLDQSGSLIQTTVSYTGFKNQFAPTGTTGCTMGVVELRGECATVSGGLSFSLPGTQYLREFKVYVPAGTTHFILSGYLPQNYDAAVVARASRTPDRTNPLNQAEYANYRTQSPYNIFDRLLAGEEIILAHSGGGGFSLAGNNTFATPLAVGVWLYLRLINGDYVDTPRATYEIDLQKYITNYNTIVFKSDGDPY